jgi:signal recognition particle subunit SRP54
MLETITRGFRSARHRLQGYRELDADTLDEVLADIRASLLEADVEIGVTRSFLDTVKQKALGETVSLSVTDKHGKTLKASPQDHFIKICHDELVALMDPGEAKLDLKKKGVATLMMVGLQGSGKTTTAAKLAKLLQTQGKRPMLVAADVYRPAAVDQLKVLGERIGVPVYHEPGKSPPELCQQGYLQAQKSDRDVVIFDTAGRLTIDQALMDELGEIRQRVPPDETLLVVDAMIGQDAVQTAKAFHDKVGIGGVVLTKLDGDARGGAALSVKMVTGAPILFAGMGEGLDKLEPFRPEGMASRILGMGDIVGLMTDFEKVVDEKKAEEDAKRMLMGKFTLVDFLEQIKILKKMGSLRDVMEKLPFFGDAVADGVKFDDKQLHKIEAIIHSMTPGERKQPEIMNARRLQRVARGSGHRPTDVQDMLQRYAVMRQMMARIGQAPGLLGQLPGFGQMGQLAKMKGMGVDQFFDGIEELAAEARKEHGQGRGGHVPMPGGTGSMAMGGMHPRMQGMMPGMGQRKAALPPPRKVDRDHRKAKNKMAAKARKKNRRK